MSPRSGGEADKFGNRYEGRWTVRHVLYALQRQGASLTVEDIGDPGQGSEFTYRRPDGAVEVHQLKRQHGSATTWTVARLRELGVWDRARGHVDAGREFHFVSVLPSPVLLELSDRARRSANLKSFVDQWLSSKDLRDAFTELSSPNALGSPEVAWKTLRGFWVQCIDETDLVNVNAVLADLLIEGASGQLSATALGDLVADNLGVELTGDRIAELLSTYDLQRAQVAGLTALENRVGDLTDGWLELNETYLLHPPIPRAESDDVVAFATGNARLGFVVGAAGGGKSGVLHQAVRTLRESNTPVLAFRLDRVEPFSSTAELGERLGLSVSPVAALASLAHEGSSLLVIDQLDAVSLASGRMPTTFDAVTDLLREAAAFPEMRVIVACRKFDVDNDHRIRQLAGRQGTETIQVGPLSAEQVDGAVTAMGLSPALLNDNQRELLQAPLHLVLLASVATDPDALNFQTIGRLFDAYWDRKRQDCTARRANTRFAPVVSTLAAEISRRQRLSVPALVLDQDDLAIEADVLVSEHVLVRDGREIAFFHEAFFDYAFARQWISRSQSLVDFLLEGEQELFRRGQVRQILTYLRDVEPDRFVDEAKSLLLSDQIRYHLKALALGILGNVDDPSSAEADAVIAVAGSHPRFEERLWQHVRKPQWFDRFDKDGHIERWLDSGVESDVGRALELMGTAARVDPDRPAEILTSRTGAQNYAAWLRRVARFAALGKSRVLFELVLDGMRAGVWSAQSGQELLLTVHGLENEQPAWTIEFLSVYLRERPGALTLDQRGQVEDLSRRAIGMDDVVEKAAAAKPLAFLDAMLPYLSEVMALTEVDRLGDYGMVSDKHFAHRYPNLDSGGELDDALLAATVRAIRAEVQRDALGLKARHLDGLATVRRDGTQFLLYQALIAAGATYAVWAAEVILEGPDRHFCGYNES